MLTHLETRLSYLLSVRLCATDRLSTNDATLGVATVVLHQNLIKDICCMSCVCALTLHSGLKDTPRSFPLVRK